MGLVLVRNVVFLYCATLGIFCTASHDVPPNITHFPKSVAVNKGGNVTLLGKLAGVKKNENITVYWRKEDYNSTVAITSNSRTISRILQNGNFSLHLQNVSFQDTGVYRCRVNCRRLGFVDGCGTELVVYVPPTPLQISTIVKRSQSSTSLTLVCKTAFFFPENLNISWYKNGSEIQSDMETIKQRNPAGLCKVSSCLIETGPFQNGTNYTCQVSHISLQTGASVHHLIDISDIDHGFPLVFMFLCLGVGLLILLLVVSIVKLFKLHTFKELQVKEDVTDEQLTYAILNFTDPKKHSNSKQMKKNEVHAEIPQMVAEERLTYSAVHFIGQKRYTEPKEQEEPTVYGTIRFKNKNRVFRTHSHVTK